MSNIKRYQKENEGELLALLGEEPEWSSFLTDDAIDTFKNALLESETFVYESRGNICGYLRALVDGFGIYVSELYVAPQYRGNSFGEQLLRRIKQEHLNQDVYVFSDEDLYYGKLAYKGLARSFSCKQVNQRGRIKGVESKGSE